MVTISCKIDFMQRHVRKIDFTQYSILAVTDLAIRHSQIAKRLFSEFCSPKRHRLFSDKRAQNCRIYLAIISSRLPVIINDIRMPNGQRSFSDADDVLFTWQDLQDLTYFRIVVRIPFQYITDLIVSSRHVCPGCCR